MLSERALWRAMTCAAESRKAREMGHVPGSLRWIDETIDELANELEVSRARQSGGGDVLHSKNDDKWLTAKQVGAMIGWGVRRVQRRRRELGGEFVGARLLFRESAIREHIEGDAA